MTDIIYPKGSCKYPINNFAEAKEVMEEYRRRKQEMEENTKIRGRKLSDAVEEALNEYEIEYESICITPNADNISVSVTIRMDEENLEILNEHLFTADNFLITMNIEVIKKTESEKRIDNACKIIINDFNEAVESGNVGMFVKGQFAAIENIHGKSFDIEETKYGAVLLKIYASDSNTYSIMYTQSTDYDPLIHISDENISTFEDWIVDNGEMVCGKCKESDTCNPQLADCFYAKDKYEKYVKDKKEHPDSYIFDFETAVLSLCNATSWDEWQWVQE